MILASTQNFHHAPLLSRSRGALPEGPAFCLPPLAAASAAATAAADAAATAAADPDAAAAAAADAAAAVALAQRPLLTELQWITQGKTDIVWYGFRV